MNHVVSRRFGDVSCRFFPKEMGSGSGYDVRVCTARLSFMPFMSFFPQPFLYIFVRKRER